MEALILSTALLLADYGQTRYISANEYYHENNIVLGRDPSFRTVDMYFAGAIAVNFSLDYVMSARRAKFVRYALIAVQGFVVSNNQRIGIGFDYNF